MFIGIIMILKEFYGLMILYFVWIVMMVIGVYREREISDFRIVVILNMVILYNCYVVIFYKEWVFN